METKTQKEWLPALVTRFWEDETFWSPTNWKTNLDQLPAVNIKENETGFQIDFAAPGYKKEDFSIHLEADRLTVKAERKEEKEEKKEHYTRREFLTSSFVRSFLLPDHADKTKMQATYVDGILTLSMPKLSTANGNSTVNIPIS
jgi:HSP20 family protein